MLDEPLKIKGHYTFECRTASGDLRWRAEIENLVTTVGKNFALDTYLSGAAYTVTGPFMGLIAQTGFTAISAADTMALHPGWLEAGGVTAPQYSPFRPTVVFSAAAGGVKTTSTAAAFAVTGTGMIVGGFIVFGPGAVSTIDSALGTLYSAGQFAEGPQTVHNGDTVNVTYQASL